VKAISGNITGKVQGVGYRMYIYRQADRLGLFGWVRNQPDGSVEFHCEGSDVDLSYFVELVKRGNDFTQVESLEYTESEAQNLTTFKVI
jgi:acylphosphatase